MTAILSDIDSAQVLFELPDHFKTISGLMVNCSKTEGMWIGALKNNKNKPFGIKWSNGPINALDVFYTYDSKLLMETYFIENLDKIKKLLNLWSSRGLSLHGKVTIIKSLVIPKFVYVSSLIPSPKEVVKDLNRMLFKFLNGGPGGLDSISSIALDEKNFPPKWRYMEKLSAPFTRSFGWSPFL